MIFESDSLYFLRKPAWLASSWWMHESFLSHLEDAWSSLVDQFHLSMRWTSQIQSLLKEEIARHWLHRTENPALVINALTHQFSHAEEYGMLNRLDTPTSWFLYFAKNREVYSQFRNRQRDSNVLKYYLLQVHGNALYSYAVWEHFTVDYPIGHHLHLDDRMVVLTDTDKDYAWLVKWTLQQVTTTFTWLSYDQEHDYTLLRASITKWARHQIRLHAKALGYPILWDRLYGSKDHEEILHLWSVGCEVNN